MKSRNLMIMTLALALSTASVFADDGGKGHDQHDGGKDGGGQVQGAARSISYQEFKDRCANPDKYRGDVQRAPENIKVQCTDVTHEYVADQSGSVPLPGSRNVVTALFSDKFNVDADNKVYAMEAKGGSCLRYKEVEKSLTVEKALSCGEILSWKDDVDSFCQANLDSLKSANPKLIQVKDTGAVIDSCGGIRGGKDPGKQ
jgi:hypothetical protein